MICIYHNKDLDGYTSGAVVRHKYPDCQLLGWDYADASPDLEQFEGEEVIMVDVTFPIGWIEVLRTKCKHLTIIDHHISFRRDFANIYQNGKYSDTADLVQFVGYKIYYIYDKRRAACEIAWEYFFPNAPVPYAITLLGRYDTWRQNEGDWEGETLPFQYAMRIKCSSPETFAPWFLKAQQSELEPFITLGNTILKYQALQDTLACKRSSFERVCYELYAICMNTRAFSSNTMKSVYDPSIHDIMIGFEYTGRKWVVSLRSDKETVDCSLIAKARGGGGHKHAAGFEVDSFDDVFK